MKIICRGAINRAPTVLIIYFLLSLPDWQAGTIHYSYAAQEEGGIGGLPVQVTGEQVEYFDTEKKMVGRGNVVVTYKDVKMTCDKVTAFLDSKEAVAEGNVVITRGEAVLKGAKITYNFETETGEILDGVAKADVWYGGGKSVKKLSKQQIDIKEGYLTTCDRDKPHYKINSKEVKIYLGRRVVARNVVFTVGGVPIFYLPVYSQPLNENFPKVNFVPGHDKNWGTYLLSSYRYNLSDDVKGNVHLDYRQYKGIAEGLDYNFKTKNIGSGNLRTYFINQRDKVQHTKSDRWRIQYRHKWEIRPDTAAVLEYHKLKDKDVIKDYFYREEFETDPQPASYISLVHTKPNYALSVLAQERVNNFFTETERLPDIELDVKNQRAFEALPFFYKGDFDAVNLDKKTGDSDQQNNAIRIDAYNQVSVPFRVKNFLSVDPYAGVRETFYSREIYSDTSRFRGAFYSGVDLSTNFYRTYGYKTDFLNLDIDGLRHIITPNLSYSYIQKPTLLREKLFEFDDIDTLDKKKAIGLALENKLQTKRLRDNELEITELARWVLYTDYIFSFEEMTNRLADISSDLELKPYQWLFLKQTALFDPKLRDMKSLNTDLAAKGAKDKWRFGLGHRYERQASSQLTTEAEARLTPKWKFRIFEMYEFKGRDLKEQEYSVTRDLHCWEAEFTYSVRDVHTFWLIFHLKAFPELPLKLGTNYYRPKAGSGGE